MAPAVDLARILLIAIGTLAAFSSAGADESEIFHKPVRLQADGKDIDTGDAWGHSGPCVADVDGDGLRDLVVGSFDGKFRFYRNVGSGSEPKYAAFKFLQAGDVDAEVTIYCCIGSSPHFVDFDSDGKLDFISGAYNPGECYLFRGLGDGKFATRETIVDKSGKPIIHYPGQHCSWPVTIDWNNDGRLDLLIGAVDGMFVRLNEGTREKPEFSPLNIEVQVAGKDLELPYEFADHPAPAVTDWDGDGRWDILSGCANGGVYFFRNIGEPGAPRFDEPQVLIAPHQGQPEDGSGFREILEAGSEPVLGYRTQIAAVDYFGTGKTDLLVGDFAVNFTPRADLTPAERQDYETLRKQSREADEDLRNKPYEGIEAEFAKRYPGDAIDSDEAQEEYGNAVRAIRAGPEFAAMKKRLEDLRGQMHNYLMKPAGVGLIDEYDTTHGYVWLFRRK